MRPARSAPTSRNGARTCLACDQSLVEGREVPWSLLVKDMPRNKHKDLDFIVGQLDWEAKTSIPTLQGQPLHSEPEIPVADTRSEGYVDRWIVYGKVHDEQLFTAKELTVDPGAKCVVKDNGAYRADHRPGQGPDEPTRISTARNSSASTN